MERWIDPEVLDRYLPQEEPGWRRDPEWLCYRDERTEAQRDRDWEELITALGLWREQTN